ncbi:histidine kinase [Imbroritus primus]|uniref:Histidine kinase n=1 Tax=Imbroritus primus TaxID=3058603 RepID=A0ACD3SR53_9BURK|nr:histidine kinase [Burkholderiaceae bacterium PBA]
MAGIGFELRKMLQKDTLLGVMKAYTYAGIISAGPWVLSILGILMIGVLSLPFVIPTTLITQFQVSVTALIMGSLIITGPLQLVFTRFAADRIFERQEELILPNYHGASLIATAVSGLFALVVAGFFMAEQSLLYRLLMVAGFVVMSNVWIAIIFMSGMKQYLAVVWIFFGGYALTVLLALWLRRYGLEGLLFGFVVGQLVLLAATTTMIYRSYTSRVFISFEMFNRKSFYFSLMAVGLFYNLGVWIDKLMFWYNPATGQQVIGPLYASVIYDIPVFLAYLAVIPGMAVFLVRIETDFAEAYDGFFTAVREGNSLERIELLRNQMVSSVRTGLYEILKIQAIAALVLFAAGGALLRLLDISELYLPLLYVDVIGASLQVLLLGVLNIFFYLDQRRAVFGLSLAFVALNGFLTWATLQLGPAWYGYGFAVALLIVVMVAVYVLDRKLESLEYDTFMLQ